MAGKPPVSFSASAVADLEEIADYYAGEQAPQTGRRLVAEIIAQAERLAEFPESGRVVPEFALGYLREIIYAPFRIVYRYDRRKVRVLRI